jgi:hypothetical protein
MSKIDRLHVAAGQDGGGCEIRTREGLHPTRFPSVRLSVHDRPGTSVTWNGRNCRVTADACELRRMRLQMRLRLERGLTPASPAREILLRLTRGEPACQR